MVGVGNWAGLGEGTWASARWTCLWQLSRAHRRRAISTEESRPPGPSSCVIASGRECMKGFRASTHGKAQAKSDMDW